MALIEKVRNTINSLLQKRDRGAISVDEFNDASKYVQGKLVRESFDFLNNIKNNAKIGRVVKVDYDKERFYKDVVRKLISTEVLTYNGTTENFELPSDYSLLEGLYYDGNEVEEVSNSERAILSMPEIEPDEVYPVCFMGSVDIEIIPSSIISGVTMYYYKQANDPKWTYNVVNNKPVFDEDKSDFVDFVLPDSIFDEIIRELSIYVGIETRQPDITQVMAKEETQSEQLKRTN